MAFTQVIKTLGSVMASMKTAVDTWLSTNITNPSNPPLDRSLSLANACAPADMVGKLKNTLDSVYDVVVYKIEIDTLNRRTPFYVHSGETVTVSAKDGGAITVGQLRLRRENGTDDYWTISGYTSRSISITEEFVSAYLTGGTAQTIVIEKTGSYLDFQPQIDELKTEIEEISLDDVISVNNITPSVNNGYIHRDGRIMEANNFRYTNPIRLENETITFKAQGYLDAVSLLSICDQNGGNRLNIVNSTNSEVVELSYKSDGVTYVIISSNVVQPIVYTSTKNILPFSIPFVNLSMFDKFGVIGDSYASGALFFNNTEKDDYAHSWGQIMARNLGTTCTNYSKGGLTTRTWLTDSKGLSLMLASNPEDIYYLVLGINDYYSLGASYLGSITDITSHSSYIDYPDTFYGNYGKIIEQIHTHAPNAKRVLFTIAAITPNQTRDAYNSAIIEIANHYGIPYIVQNDDPFFMSDFFNKTKVEGHPIAITYSGMASAFERLLIQCIKNNVAYFRDTYWYN